MKWTRPIEAVLAILLALLSCLVFINVILRYGFGTSILSTDELSRYMFVWLTFLGAIVACAQNAHVDVRALVDKLPPKGRDCVDILGNLGMIACCVMLFVGGWQQTALNWSNYEPVTGIPSALMYLACIPTSIGIGLILLWRVLKTLRRLFGGEAS